MSKPRWPGELTGEEFLAKVEAGIFYDRLDSFMPPDMYGPPTEAELAAAAREQAKQSRTNGQVTRASARRRRARRAAGAP